MNIAEGVRLLGNFDTSVNSICSQEEVLRKLKSEKSSNRNSLIASVAFMALGGLGFVASFILPVAVSNIRMNVTPWPFQLGGAALSVVLEGIGLKVFLSSHTSLDIERLKDALNELSSLTLAQFVEKQEDFKANLLKIDQLEKFGLINQALAQRMGKLCTRFRARTKSMKNCSTEPSATILSPLENEWKKIKEQFFGADSIEAEATIN